MKCWHAWRWLCGMSLVVGMMMVAACDRSQTPDVVRVTDTPRATSPAGRERVTAEPTIQTQGQPLAETPAGTEVPVPVGEGSEGPHLALYLAEADFKPAHLVLDPETGDPPVVSLEPSSVLTADDIVSYALETHTIELTRDAALRLSALQVPTDGRVFVIMVDDEPIYAGALWTPLSSLSFDGVTIQLLPSAAPRDNKIRLELGYPGPSFFRGEDPRSDPKIVTALTEAGKVQ